MNNKYFFIYSMVFSSFVLGSCEQSISTRSPVDLGQHGVTLDTEESYSLGPQTPPIYMDAEALKYKFQDLFGLAYPRGEKWAADLNKRINIPYRYEGEYIEIGPDTYFSPEEAKAFGTYKVHAGLLSTISKTRINFNRMKIFSQGYIKSLRAFLADSCDTRVMRDRQAILDKKETYIMHAHKIPTPTEINEFMAEMFGIPSTEGLMAGASEYNRVFIQEHGNLMKELKGKKGDEIEKGIIENLYKVLCISVGQDPRVFLR